MSYQISDRVKEQSIVTGTGPVTLLGTPLPGYQTFAATTTPSNTTTYVIDDPIDGNWETGLGTWNGTQLTRTTPYASSNGGALVNFAGHLCNVFQDVPANFVAPLNVNANSVIANFGTVSQHGTSALVGDSTNILVFGGDVDLDPSLNTLNATSQTTYYLTAQPDISGISTYFTAARVPSTTLSQTYPVALTGTTLTNIAIFITPPGDPSGAAFPLARLKHLIYGNIDGGVITWTVQVSKRSIDGTEVALNVAVSSNFTATTTTPVFVRGRKNGSTALLPTDRLVYRVRATRVSGPATINANLVIDTTNNRPTVQSTITGTGVPNQGYGEYDVRSFGAVADALTYTDAIMTAGSATLASQSATFTGNDLNKPIWVNGAGVGGLSGAPFQSTIAAIVNSHTITCAGTADTATTGVQTLLGALVDTGGTAGYFLPGTDTISVIGGTATVTAILNVISTTVNPPTDTAPAFVIVSPGSGGKRGTYIFETSTQSGTPARIRVVIDSTGVATSLTYVFGGLFLTNPGTSAEPLVNTESGLTGLTVSIASIGVRSVSVNTGGSYSVLPSGDPFATTAGSVSGATGCTLEGVWGGSGQFLYGTNARDQIAAAITQANAITTTSRAVVTIPAGNYLIDGAVLPLNTQPVLITGAGPNQTNVILAPSYAGPYTFAWSNMFPTGPVTPNVGDVGAPTQSDVGWGVSGLTIAANRASANRQSGVIVYDRCDSMIMTNVQARFLNGSALWIGVPNATINGFLRESSFNALYFKNCGDNNYPVINLDSNGTTAGSNFLRFEEINIVFPVGPGLSITNHTTKRDGVKTLYFDGLRIERSPSVTSYGDELVIGSVTDLNAVTNVYMSNVHLVGAGPGVSALSFNGVSEKTRPHDIHITGLLINGPVLGTGISVNAGYNIYIDAEQIEGRTASIATGNHSDYRSFSTAVAGSTSSTVATVAAPNGANVGNAAVMAVTANAVVGQAGTLLTISAINSGRLLPGSYITTVQRGVESVVSFGTGTGGTGTYNMSRSQVITPGTTIDFLYTESRNAVSSVGTVTTIGALQGSAATWTNTPLAGDSISFQSLIDADFYINGDGQEANYVYVLGSGVSSLITSPWLLSGVATGTGTTSRDVALTGTVTLPSAIITGGTIDGLSLTGMTAGSLIYSSGTAALANVALGSHLAITGGTLDASGFGTVTSVIAGTGMTGGTITTTGTLGVAAATTATLGGVIVGANINVTGGTISVAAPGTGTVTSIAETFTGGLISSAGSPIVGAGTLALTVAGTSGGIVYFNSGTSWASSGALTQHGVVVGGGAGATPVSIAVGTSGQALISAGSTADPAFGLLPLAGIALGTAGGIPYYNGTGTLASSGLLTSNAIILSLGVSGAPFTRAAITTDGVSQILLGTTGSGFNGALVVKGGTTGTITITPQLAAGTYSFNLPTGAGSSGQPMLSGGGGSTAMTFGTLGVAAGGTGLAAWTTNTLIYASGTATLAGLALGTNLAIASGTLNASSGISSIVGGTGLTGGTITTTGTLAVAAATTASLGGVIIGSNIAVNSGTISAGSPGLAWQTGRFYSMCTPQGTGAASSKVCVSPIIVPNDITAVSLSIYCGSSTGANINVYLGVYADSGGMPGSKLAATPLISYASGTTGAQTGAISLAMKAGTVYWLVSSLGAALNCTYLAQPSGSENYGANPIAGMIGATTVAAMLGQAVTGLYASDTPGVLPTTLSGLTVNNNAFTQPVVVIGT